LLEVLDLINGKWISNKCRGYDVVIINLYLEKDLCFGIPLRSRITHGAAYITNITNEKNQGLDYSKALLLQEAYISNDPFKIPNEEHKKILNHSEFIKGQFQKYVEKYIKAVNQSDNNVIKSEEYKNTTLKNYHKELGI